MSVFTIDVIDQGVISDFILRQNVAQKHTEMAAFRALNKTARWLRTKTVRSVSQQTGLQQKLIRERLQMLSASRRQLKAHLISKDSYIPAHKLGRLKQTATGAQAGKFHYEGAFVAEMPSTGHASVFKRKRKSRLPIREMGFYFGGVTGRTWEEDVLDKQITERFEHFFEHELNFLLSKQR